MGLSIAPEPPTGVTWGQVFLSALLASILSYSIVLGYRLTFHPLAKYPGRFWDKLTDWPLVFYCHQGNRHIKQLLAHKKHGPVVRDGPNSLSFSSPSALKAIYGPNAHVKKGDWYLTLDISAGAPSIQMVQEQEQHTLRRRVISPAFSDKALRDAEPLINANAQKLCSKMYHTTKFPDKQDWSEALNLYNWIAYYGYDFISDLAFGRSFELLDDESHRFLPSLLRHASQFNYWVGYLPCIDLVRPLLGTWVQDLIPDPAAKEALRYMNLANVRLAERMAIEEERKSEKSDGASPEDGRRDVFHYLLNSKDPQTGKGFTTEELQADTALLIAAGSDGITTAVAALFFYVLRDDRVHAKLVQEICEEFASAADIQTPKLKQLSYLHACIEEALRLSPPKPASLPRVVLPGGTTIDGHFVPAGTNVGVAHYVVHRDPEIFSDPQKFLPERWILSGSVSPEQLAHQKRAFCPFSIGPMNCIGKNIAYSAMELAIAHLFFEFEFKQVGKGKNAGGGWKDAEDGRRDEGEYQLWDWILGFPDGPIVELRKRR